MSEKKEADISERTGMEEESRSLKTEKFWKEEKH